MSDVFDWEPVETFIADPQFRPLIEMQWRALSHIGRPPEIDFAQAFRMEKAGAYRIWTARRGERLIGFIQWYFIQPITDRGMLWAVDGGHYVEPDGRATISTLLAMWRGSEVALRAKGVKVMRSHDNEKRPLGPLFKRLGYTMIGSQYQKVL